MVDESRKYKIIEPLGKGGFGTVYRAELIGAGGFRKLVALKIVHPDLVGSDDIVSRLRDEARMLGLVRHPGIVHVDGLVQLGGRWALVMEHVPGASLEDILRHAELPLRCAVEIIGKIADALHAAHTAQEGGRPLHLIHRDLKPGNIMIGPAGEVMLLDFGVARAEFDTRESKTQSILLGSPHYMAPERWELKDVPAGDIYSLGVTLYEIFTNDPFGRAGLSRERHAEKLKAVTDTLTVGRNEDDEIPEEVQVLLTSMLAYDPEKRPTARQVESTCRNLAPCLSGLWLRDWAEQIVPHVQSRRPHEANDPLAGSTLAEPTGAERTSGLYKLTEAIPKGNKMLWLGVAAVGAIVAVAGGTAWFIASNGEDPPERTAPALVAIPPPQVEAPPPVVEPTVKAEPRKTQARKEVAVPAPRASSAPASPPPATSGRVVLGGGADEIYLQQGSNRFGTGSVPAGTYTVMARFPGRGVVSAGKVTVTAGQTVTLSCEASFAMCRVTK